MGDFVRVASVNDLGDDEIMQVDVGDEQVLLAKLDGRFYAIGEECTHAGGPLSQGYVEDGQVECPLHGGVFDLKTGANTAPPAADPVKSYPVRIEGDDVLVGTTE
jgi:3-phenylpropionate/trans-cinnamate dioxygenase ferredoxin subunit